MFPPTFGGVEQHIWDVCRSLGPDFALSVLTASRSRRSQVDDVDGVRVVRSAELGRLLSTPLTPSWWGELRREDADVVHVHLPSPLAELGCLAGRTRAPVVASFHADIVRNPGVARCYLPLRHRFLARSQRIVAGSPVLAQTSGSLRSHRERVTVIPYGVDPDEWPAAPDVVEAIREEFGRPLVLFLGRLVPYKGVDVLIDAMRSVDATLLVAGDGPARPALEARAAAYPPAMVRFAGNVANEDRSAYYRAADVFVLPAVSRAESFGIAMLEAMAQGTPAISTDVGTGTSWVNQHGKTGLVVRPADPAALGAAIASVLSDDARRAGMGSAAAARAREHFSRRVMLERLVALYREVASG